MEEILSNIKSQYDSFIGDAQKFVEKGNKTAGVRARKASLKLAESLKAFRKESLK